MQYTNSFLREKRKEQVVSFSLTRVRMLPAIHSFSGEGATMFSVHTQDFSMTIDTIVHTKDVTKIADIYIFGNPFTATTIPFVQISEQVKSGD